jgi:hypothetical protein
LNPGFADGFHATLKDGIFDGVGVIGDDFEKSESDGEDDHKKSEENSYDKK